MTEPDVYGTDPTKLSRLWQCETGALTEWQPEELGSIFKHLLAAPLGDELGTFDPQSVEKLRQLETTPGETFDTFGDLLHHEQPSLDLLNLVKDFSKRAGSDESLPTDVAYVLYAAVISTALVHCGERITSADDPSLRSKIKWAASRNWIDPATKELLEKALAHLS